MQTKVTDLVNAGRFRAALNGLTTHPKRNEDDERYDQHLNMMIGSLTGIETDEMDGTASPEFTLRQKAKLRKSIGLFTRMFGITHVEAQPVVVVERTLVAAPSEKPVEKPGILFLASDPRGMGKLKLNDEFVKIRTHLDDKVGHFKLELKFEQRPDTLTKTILDERPTYVHFAGHGVGTTDEDNLAGIVLEDRERNPQIVTGVALANMFRLLKKRFDIKAVVLNACNSTEQAMAISTNGIYTIGMADEIPDHAAIAFAGGFYLGLAETPDDIPFAYEMALNSLLMEGVKQEEVPMLFYAGAEVII
jgi:hypothetical protein